MRVSVAFLFVFLSAFVSAQNESEPKLWAVLVAGSNGYDNYRHQADVYHAYQIMHKHGIPDERIIMFHYDDIANDPENPFPGKVFNKPGGKDVYHNVLRDYTGSQVTPENFIKVLKGDAEGMKGIGSGKVLKSGPNDHVFVNFADHGDTGIVCFPEEDLTVQQLQDTIKYMHENKKFGKLVFYVEACFSGTMFDSVLPDNINVFATTAANTEESSWGCYCDEPQFNTCLGDLYSVNWMEDSDKENIEKETLQKQFQIVQVETNLSHPQEYGELSIGKLTVGQFQGLKQAAMEPIDLSTMRPAESKLVRSEDIPLFRLKQKMMKTNSKVEYLKLQKQMEIMHIKRALVNATIEGIALEITNGDYECSQDLINRRSGRVRDTACHHYLVKAFANTCFNLGKNPFAMKFANVANNICNDGRYNVATAVVSIQSFCLKVLAGTV